MMVADALRGLDRKPIGQRLLRPVDDKTPAILARLDDPAQSVRIRRRIFGDSRLLEGLKQLLEAVVPVRMPIDDVPAQEFRGRVGVGDVVVAYRDDEAWIGKLLPHHVADRQLLFHARLVGVRRENHDLLYGFVAKHRIDFIPGIRASAQAPAIDPYAVTSDRQFGGKPKRELIVVRRSVRDENGCSGLWRGRRDHARLESQVETGSERIKSLGTKQKRIDRTPLATAPV